MWSIDSDKSQQRYKALQDYYKEKSLNADNFSCQYFEHCLQSQTKNVVKQYSGGTSALMPFYDVKLDGIDVRILIIGKETGYMQNCSYGTASNFDENSLNVLNCVNWKKKNNHIKGTLQILQEIFNVDSEYIYSSYALSDALRCAFQLANKKENVSAVNSTQCMFQNCISYLLDEIDILEPTLIIAQGEWSIRGKENLQTRLNERYGRYKKILYKNSNEKYGLYEYDKFMFLTCHHPAILGNWQKNLAVDSVWPAIRILKEIGYLPNIKENQTEAYLSIVKSEVDKRLKGVPSNDRLREKRRSDNISGNQLSLFEVDEMTSS